MSIAPTSDFDWSGSAALVVEEQPAIAVYVNTRGSIVVRQEAPWDSDEDPYIIIRPENAVRIARAIIREAERPFPDDFPDEPEDEEANAPAPVATALPTKPGNTNRKAPQAEPALSLMAAGGAE